MLGQFVMALACSTGSMPSTASVIGNHEQEAAHLSIRPAVPTKLLMCALD
jgi:hypothetical protein